MKVLSNLELPIILPRSIVEDNDLSLEAIGVLAALCSERLYETKSLLSYSSATEAQLKASLKLLVAKGYLVKREDSWTVDLATAKSTDLRATSPAITDQSLGSLVAQIEPTARFKVFVQKQLSAYSVAEIEEALQACLRAKPLEPIRYLAGTLKRGKNRKQSEKSVKEDY